MTFLIFALIGYTITSVIVESKLFEPIRSLFEFSKLTARLVNCQLCMSIWVSVALSYWVILPIDIHTTSCYEMVFLNSMVGSALIMFLFYFENFLNK